MIKKILIVEDDKPLVRTFKRLLSSHEIYDADCIEKSIDLIDKHGADLDYIFLDFDLINDETAEPIAKHIGEADINPKIYIHGGGYEIRANKLKDLMKGKRVEVISKTDLILSVEQLVF